MIIATVASKHAIHDKLESQIKTAEAKLDTLKARAAAAKANAEIKAIAELTVQKAKIHQKLEELKKAAEDRWENAKADLVLQIASFEKAVEGIEARLKAR
jgi:phage shock protein A